MHSQLTKCTLYIHDQYVQYTIYGYVKITLITPLVRIVCQ